MSPGLNGYLVPTMATFTIVQQLQAEYARRARESRSRSETEPSQRARCALRRPEVQRLLPSTETASVKSTRIRASGQSSDTPLGRAPIRLGESVFSGGSNWKEGNRVGSISRGNSISRP